MLFLKREISDYSSQIKLERQESRISPFLQIRDVAEWQGIELEYYQASLDIIQQQFQDFVVLIFLTRGTIQFYYTDCEDYNLVDNNNVSNYCEYKEKCSIQQQSLQKNKFYNVISGSTILIPRTITAWISWFQPLDFAVLIIKSLARDRIEKELELNLDSMKSKAYFEQSNYLSYLLIISLLSGIKKDRHNYNFYTVTLLKTLIIHLCQKHASVLIQSSKNQKVSPKIIKAIAYIQENIDKKLYIEEIAAAANISKYYFCKLFRQSMGISPYQYLLQQKIEYSKILLQEPSKFSLAEISLKCGFANQSHFSKCFRQYTGMTPKTYRDRISNSKISWL